MLTDEHRSKLKTIMLEAGLYDKSSLRLNVEGVLYRMHIGCPWRIVPENFGYWNTIYKKLHSQKRRNGKKYSAVW